MPSAPNRELSRREASGLPRFSRLYPVYVFSLLLSAGMLVQELHAHTRIDFTLGVILTPLLLQGWHPTLVDFLEHARMDHVHGGVLLSVVPVADHAPPSTPVERLVLLMLCGVWLCGLVLPALYMHFNPDGDLHPDRYSVGIWMRALKFMPMQHLPSFLFGMALAFLND